jgi:hypothetical protein
MVRDQLYILYVDTLKKCVLIIFSARSNIAVGKESYQSSTYQERPSIYGPQRANDGNTNGILFSTNDVSCTHTKIDTLPYWWAVDLGQKYVIDSISIYNRQDCCGNITLFCFMV